MCEYCKNAATGDDWFSFAEKKVDIGHLGVLVMEASIEKENIVTGDPVLVLYLTHQAGIARAFSMRPAKSRSATARCVAGSCESKNK